MKQFAFISALLILILTNHAQEENSLKVKGYVDTYHAARMDSPNDFLASRSRLRTELENQNGNSYFFASMNAINNNVIPEKTGIELREAFLEYSATNWSLKAGRQIIIWGQADGIRITDVISPMDLTEFLAQDYDDIRMPVDAIKFNRFGSNWKVELLYAPTFKGYILPDDSSPWGFGFGDLGINEEEASVPEFELSNMEIGSKLSFYLSGIDFDLSALKGWNKAPVYTYSMDSVGAFHIHPEHHELNLVGFGFSKSLNAFIIRGESAYNFNKKFSPLFENYNYGLAEKNSLRYLLGIDCYPGREWTITGQFSDEYIIGYDHEIAQDEHTYISTLGVSKKLLRSTLTLSTFAYLGLNEKDAYYSIKADYSLSDNIHLLTGVDLFQGDSGAFGKYNRNSQVWLKAKYSF